MFRSPCPLPDAIRGQGAEVLNDLVAKAIVLHDAAYKAHHNVRGPAFGPLHALFQEVFEGMDEVRDRLAERVATLGAVAVGTAEEALKVAGMAPYPTDITDGFEHARALFDRLSAFDAAIYAASERIEEMKLIADVNALGDVAEQVEKLAWKIVSHIP